MKKGLIGLLFLLFIGMVDLKASHSSGGIITYEYVGNNQYRFYLYFIRNCTGTSIGNTVSLNTTVPGIPNLTLTRDDTIIVQDDCGSPFGSGITLNCAQGQGFELFRYSSSAIDFSNVPPPPLDGYHFSFSLCCREISGNLTGTPNFYIQTTMHRVEEQGVSLTPAQLQDNSPVPFGWPELVSYLDTDTILRQLAAIDKDGDELRYQLITPLSDFQTNASYKLPQFSLAGLPFTGAIRANGMFLDSMNATYLTTNAVHSSDHIAILIKSYRCGQISSSAIFEINRKVILPPSSASSDQPPLVSGYGVASNGEMYLYPTDTLRASIAVTDTQAGYPNFIRAYFPAAISLSRLQLAANCTTPPCLQLTATTTTNPVPQWPQVILNGGDTLGYGFTAESGLSAQLMAYTDCNQFLTSACGDTLNQINLPFIVTDSRCAVNNRVELPLRLVQMPLPHLNTPQLQLISDNSGQLSWESPLDSTLNLPGLTTVGASLRVQTAAFKRINIYRSSFSNPNNYTLAATITDVNQRIWVDPIGNATYYIRVVSGCDDFESPPSNIVASFASSQANEKMTDVKVFPNPTSDLIQVNNGNTQLDLRLLDIQGRELQNLGELGENENQSYDLSRYPGIVILELKTAYTTSYRRLVILR